MKAHIGVDKRTGLVHNVTSTVDVTEMANPLHGEERYVFGAAGYMGAPK